MLNKDRHTIPVENIIQTNKSFIKEYQENMFFEDGLYYKLSNKKLINIHKDVFGKQSYCCFFGEFKFWVWDYGDWRIFVNNNKGLCIEVDPSLTPKKTMEVLRNYWSKFYFL